MGVALKHSTKISRAVLKSATFSGEIRKPASLKIAILKGLVNIGSRAARFNFTTLKVGILRAVYDELNKIVKNNGADTAAADTENYLLIQ